MGFDDGDCVFCALNLHEMDEDDLQAFEFICCNCMEDNIGSRKDDRRFTYNVGSWCVVSNNPKKTCYLCKAEYLIGFNVATCYGTK